MDSDDNEVQTVRSEFVPPRLAIYDQLLTEWDSSLLDTSFHWGNPLEETKLPDEDGPGDDIFTGSLLP